jgi:general secretion pathway protein F
MPVYAYRGVATGNRSTRGMVNAESMRSARAKLRAEGIFPTELTESRTRGVSTEMLARLRLPQLQRVPDLDLALFSSQHSTLIEAGVPLVESLSALTEQIENTRLKAMIGRVREAVNQGASLGDALGEYPQTFDTLYRSMVQAGESSGSLPLVLRRLASYVESRMQLRNQLISAMIYPVLMLTLSFIMLGVLLVTAVPSITALIEDRGLELPLLTRVVIACSDFLGQWWVVIVVVIVTALLAFSRLIQTEWGRLWWDRFRLGLPVLGRAIRHVSISRFARTLATLLSGGVDIVQALNISKAVANNAVIGRAIEAASEAITKGTTIAQPLRQSGEFPPLVTHMISVGEASGELDTMLAKVSDTYDELVANSLNRLNALMGPVLLLFVAAIVVLVLLSTLLPLMQLTRLL